MMTLLQWAPFIAGPKSSENWSLTKATFENSTYGTKTEHLYSDKVDPDIVIWKDLDKNIYIEKIRSGSSFKGLCDVKCITMNHGWATMKTHKKRNTHPKPIESMYGIFTYMLVNVGKYTIHGSYGKRQDWGPKFIPASTTTLGLAEEFSWQRRGEVKLTRILLTFRDTLSIKPIFHQTTKKTLYESDSLV